MLCQEKEDELAKAKGLIEDLNGQVANLQDLNNTLTEEIGKLGEDIAKLEYEKNDLIHQGTGPKSDEIDRPQFEPSEPGKKDEYRTHSIVSRVTSGSKDRFIRGNSDNTSEQFSSVTEDISSAGEEITRSTSVEETKVIETIKAYASTASAEITHNGDSSQSGMQSHHYYHYILDTRKSKYEFGLKLR